jgi:hypothetical protein
VQAQQEYNTVPKATRRGRRVKQEEEYVADTNDVASS